MRILPAALLLLLLSLAANAGTTRKPSDPSFREAVQRTASMVGDADAVRLASKHGLQVLNITWEDTGRFKGSSVGPNISDMSIQVHTRDDRGNLGGQLMPVIRYDNFSDKTADLSPEDFHLLVGNEDGTDLRRITLYELLEDPTRYLHDPDSWKSTKPRSLLAKTRDSHVLVSAQACFLPVPKSGIAEFNPVLFNYQSYGGDPAVLTILATREGTSMTIIDNQRDAFDGGGAWGQRLFFNKNGERASFTGKRMSDFVAAGGATGGSTVKASGQEGLNMVLLIQVPLKQKAPARGMFGGAFGEGLAPTTASSMDAKSRSSDVEAAVIGHGEVEGPFTEIAGLDIERDERFPVRVTVQFYKATSNGIVSEKDMKEIASQIEKVYANATYVGSLVTGGETGRPTEYFGATKTEPPQWWDAFWTHYEKNLGIDRRTAIRELRNVHGEAWVPEDQAALARAIRETRSRPR